MISKFQQYIEITNEDVTISKSGAKNINDFKTFVDQRVTKEINGDKGPDKTTPEGKEIAKVTDNIKKNVENIEKQKSEVKKDIDNLKKNVDKTIDKTKDFSKNIDNLQKEKDKL